MSRNRFAAPFPAYEEDAAFADLLALMQSDRPPLVLIGAGASVASNYPAWNELLTHLKETALEGDKGDWRRSLDDLSDAPWIAEVFASRLKTGALGALINQLYASRGALAEPHLSLARMRFPHFLTTNYDPSIEEALTRAGRTYRTIVWPNGSSTKEDIADGEALSEFLIGLGRRRDESSIVYLHGRFDSDEDKIVLTESDYVARYIASDDARRKLMAIFMTHPVLFVGFSMNDPDLANLMREVTARLKAKTPCHYALMGYKGDADREAIRARMIGKFGVRPVFFSRTPVDENGDEYSNLLLLLDALAGEKDRKRVAEAKPTDPERKSASRVDPDDPRKGQFGGEPEANGRRLSVRRLDGGKKDEKLNLELMVDALPGAPPLTDEVLFYLHPTFHRSVVASKVVDGKASLTRWAYGAFTVGAVCDNGNTRLELDLAELGTLPLWFRRR